MARFTLAFVFPNGHNAGLRSDEAVGIPAKPTAEEPLENLLGEMPKGQGALDNQRR